MAVLAGPNEKLDAAKFLENAEKPQYDKAVILYEKAGYAGKALELAFETKQHNVLQVLTTKPFTYALLSINHTIYKVRIF